MTINALHKLLGKLIARGHGRRKVCINKRTFRHNCESDGIVILDAEAANLKSFWVDDGDGCMIANADGTLREKTALVLTGGLADKKGKEQGEE